MFVKSAQFAGNMRLKAGKATPRRVRAFELEHVSHLQTQSMMLRVCDKLKRTATSANPIIEIKYTRADQHSPSPQGQDMNSLPTQQGGSDVARESEASKLSSKMRTIRLGV